MKGLEVPFPLRIFITSRKVHDLQRIGQSLARASSATLTQIEIGTKDTIQDIEHYIQSRTETRLTDPESILSRDELVQTLVQKSNASFLWVKLVLDELEEIYTEEGITSTLNTIPEGMVPYYERTVQYMAKKREKHVAKAVLMWVVASLRRLHISELAQALKLQLKTVLPSAKNAVEGLCGQLVCVDGGSGFVSVVHPTVREFLLSDAAGDFKVHEAQAHENIAWICLDLLCSAEMQPPRTQGQLNRKSKTTPPSALLDYAIMHFSEHVCLASCESGLLLTSLDLFFKLNVLSWIEAIANRRDIHPLIRASKNLKAYLDRREECRSPLSMEAQNLGAWSTDLSQIATRFGSALLDSPTSIYLLIPPLCPSSSAIYRRFAGRPNGLTLVGCIESVWDDCIASVRFDQGAHPRTVSCSDSLVAVGINSRAYYVDLYDFRSFQKAGRLEVGHPVYMVHLTDKNVVVCAKGNLSLLDREGNVLWATPLDLPFGCMFLTSTLHHVALVSGNGHVMTWDLSSGNLLKDQVLKYRARGDEDVTGWFRNTPLIASLSHDLETVAMGFEKLNMDFKERTVCLYDNASGDFIGWAGDERQGRVKALFFNPDHSVHLLMKIDVNHQLTLLDAWSGDTVRSRKGPKDSQHVCSAAVSPNGRMVATMGLVPILYIFDFKSLELLSCIAISSAIYPILAFTSDSSGVVQIIDEGIRLWAPAALARKNVQNDRNIHGDETAISQTLGEEYETRDRSTITTLAAHHVLPVVFSGKGSGDVIAFDAKTGNQIAILYSHGSMAAISWLAVSRGGMLASIDFGGNIQVWSMGNELDTMLEGRRLLFKTKLCATGQQISFTSSGKYLLVSSYHTDTVYRTTDGARLTTFTRPQQQKYLAWEWLESCPDEKDDSMFLVCGNALTKFDLPSMARTVVANLQFPTDFLTNFPEANWMHAIRGTGSIHYHSKTLIISCQPVKKRTGLTSPFTFVFNIEKAVDSSQWQASGSTHTFEHSSNNNESADQDETLNGGSGVVDVTISTTPSPESDVIKTTTTTLTGSLIKGCKQVVGVNERINKLVFLHRSGWVCTIDARPDRDDEDRYHLEEYTRHFFMLDNEMSSSRIFPRKIPPINLPQDNNSIAFCRHHELLVVKNGFNQGQTRRF